MSYKLLSVNKVVGNSIEKAALVELERNITFVFDHMSEAIPAKAPKRIAGRLFAIYTPVAKKVINFP